MKIKKNYLLSKSDNVKNLNKLKKRCDEAVRQNGPYSFNIISLVLSGLKEALR